MKTVLLASFQDVEPAQQLRKRLEEAGIQTILHDESKLQRLWFISEPVAALHIEVRQTDYPRAAGLVAEWRKAEGALAGAISCPSCQSARVEFPQMTRKFFTPSLGSVLFAIGLVPRSFYCLDCHHTWPLVKGQETQRDALGWPTQSKLWHAKEGHPDRRS
jgi:hypothetical protein